MSNNRGERVLLVCDEAYLMIDPQVPQSLAFLRNVEKRSRKYESAWRSSLIRWWISWRRRSRCTGRHFGYSLLQNPDGLRTDKNLQETTDLYNLTDAEQELLESEAPGTRPVPGRLQSGFMSILRFRLQGLPTWARRAAGNTLATGMYPAAVLIPEIMEVFL